MATLIPFVFTQFFDNNGDPLNGGKVYTYEAGTSTPKATFTDSTGDTANANPVILDSAGRASIWLGDGGYKFILTNSADVAVGTTFDNIGGVASTAFAGNTQEISSNTTVDATLANSAFIATAALTLSLLDVATAGEGFYFSVFAQGGDVTIDPDTTETINNASTLVVPQGSSAIVTCDGDEWWTIAYAPSFSGNNSFTGSNSFTGKVLFPDDGELTIATGAITVTGVFHTVDTESDAASDDLDTISGGSDGQILVLRTENASRDVSVTNAGNIVTPDGATFVLSATGETCVLIYDGALTKWIILSKNTAASATSRGEVELATDAEFQTGTDTARAVTPANVKNSLGFSDYFESAQQTITAAGALTIAHGLGRKPILVQALVICTSGENGYSINDELLIPYYDTSASASGYGVAVVPDATNLNCRFGNAATASFIALNKSTGAVVTLTNANWRLVLRAWA